MVKWTIFWGILVGIELAPFSPQSPPDEPDPLERAVSWIEAESEWRERFDYLTGGEVRLLVVWTGEDDVGRGYIRLGRKQSNPELETISLLFGSIPERAPLDLNRWGAATETLRRDPETGAPVASAFLGFRKASADVEAAEERPEGEGGEGNFEASLNYVGTEEAVARVLLVDPGEELDLGGMEQVRRQALERFRDETSSPKRLGGAARRCANVTGFLFTMKDLLEEIASRNAPQRRCYVYNATEYFVAVENVDRIESREVTLQLETGEELKRSYRDLVDVELKTLNQASGNTTSFNVVIGTRGELKGVPVEIVYRPSMWVRIRIQLRETEVQTQTAEVDR